MMRSKHDAPFLNGASEMEYYLASLVLILSHENAGTNYPAIDISLMAVIEKQKRC